MAKKSYIDRLKISIEGSEDTKFYTKSGTLVAKGYVRVVIGGRGPYIEFTPQQIVGENFEIPDQQRYRLNDKRVYYIEARSKDSSYVKIYYQKRTVAYADYKEGLCYISPFDLKTENVEDLVEKIE